MTAIDLNPDGPHSAEHTAEAGALFDACSKFLVYATMGSAPGLEYPSEVYRLLGEIYSAMSRLPQLCEQLDRYLRAQLDAGRLYEARRRDLAVQVGLAAADLDDAATAARTLTRALQAVQADISGLGVKGTGDDR